MANNYDVNAKADEILKIAEEYGVEKNFLFITTFKRYIKEIEYLQQLEENIKEKGLITIKYYTKNKPNEYLNPCFKEYTNTTNSANKTVSTLMNIIKSNSSSYADDKTEDPLLKALNGDGEDEE